MALVYSNPKYFMNKANLSLGEQARLGGLYNVHELSGIAVYKNIWFFSTFYAEFLIKVDNFGLKSRLTGAYSLNFRITHKRLRIMANTIAQQGF